MCQAAPAVLSRFCFGAVGGQAHSGAVGCAAGIFCLMRTTSKQSSPALRRQSQALARTSTHTHEQTHTHTRALARTHARRTPQQRQHSRAVVVQQADGARLSRRSAVLHSHESALLPVLPKCSRSRRRAGIPRVCLSSQWQLQHPPSLRGKGDSSVDFRMLQQSCVSTVLHHVGCHAMRSHRHCEGHGLVRTYCVLCSQYYLEHHLPRVKVLHYVGCKLWFCHPSMVCGQVCSAAHLATSNNPTCNTVCPWPAGCHVRTVSGESQRARHGVAWRGVARHCTARRGMAWHGLAWHGMARQGLARCGMQTSHSLAVCAAI